MADPNLDERLRTLADRWRAQARHPNRAGKPEERMLLERCADQLLTELNGGVPWPRNSS